MPKYFFIIVYFNLFLNLPLFSQNNNLLKYDSGYFYKMGEYSESWKTASYIFKDDENLANKYNKFKRSKRAAKIFGNAALSQVLIGFIVWRSFDCHTICFPQIISAGFLLIGAPICGLTSLTLSIISRKRNKILLNAFNRKQKNISHHKKGIIKLDIGIGLNGLKAVLLF